MISIAQQIPAQFPAHQKTWIEFGDNDGRWGGTALGEVFDYEMRSGGYTESFRWVMDELLR
jgi:hypothetical protein